MKHNSGEKKHFQLKHEATFSSSASLNHEKYLLLVLRSGKLSFALVMSSKSFTAQHLTFSFREQLNEIHLMFQLPRFVIIAELEHFKRCSLYPYNRVKSFSKRWDERRNTNQKSKCLQLDVKMNKRKLQQILLDFSRCAFFCRLWFSCCLFALTKF